MPTLYVYLDTMSVYLDTMSVTLTVMGVPGRAMCPLCIRYNVCYTYCYECPWAGNLPTLY